MNRFLAWAITLLWVACYGRKLVDPEFPVPAEATPVMLLAAGYLFGRDVKEKLRERVKRAVEAFDDGNSDAGKRRIGRNGQEGSGRPGVSPVERQDPGEGTG